MVASASHNPTSSRGFAVYLHWPFCLAKCPYCDFNSHVRDGVDQDAWRRALLDEIDRAAARLPGREVGSIFFGGGTPSLMPAATVAAIIDRIAGHWGMDGAVEITLEANPTSVEAGRFRAYAAAGVNRLSLGVQALNDTDLRRLGRNHDAREAMAALSLARDTFARCNFDLIYARPGQDEASWRAELSQALELGPSHLSLYQLSIEKGTAFDGTVQAADGDLAADLFEATQQMCLDAGLPAYEISNHAALGQECRHNLTYWRYGEYLGLGPGAHGRLLIDGERLATSQRTSPEKWLAGEGRASESVLSREERATEMLMMGMRLTQGVNGGDFKAEVGMPLVDWLAGEGLDRLLAGGLLSWQGENLAASDAGLQVLNAVLAELLP
ncbi:MAG: coproporphyrinogen III oxidase [Rhodospirillaceae bacterium]|jgi:oxygen-independent coproporphyrinogen-3 oxidase|nr:coproporphyrinogen III oxidase [Rhodospirillaceae bacterium]MBT3494662.1 coproporphyrinogen III oxidase [Rhodospirillaceae bacterium]MBT3780848.1 coproporphyrinogen III oxidase [Rhodospirillaceae bacterium]MBT3978951.1 coproporphyrinogen III oxidase [Rhodospirillaceae bacterium]MBT4170880.1 coproporphyrinogen III oxidase [Rhodospirillaceae bacterium]